MIRVHHRVSEENCGADSGFNAQLEPLSVSQNTAVICLPVLRASIAPMTVLISHEA